MILNFKWTLVGQQLSTIIQNSSATVGDGKVMGTSIVKD